MKRNKQQFSTAKAKALMIAALEKSLGIVTHAAKEVGIDRTSHYGWLLDDPEYAKAVEGAKQVQRDFVESSLMELVRGARREVVTNQGDIKTIREAPNASAVIFAAKALNGFKEKSEVEHSGSVGITSITLVPASQYEPENTDQ